VMDGPTSSLTAHETERLFQIIGDLRRSGVGILYVSHRLKEVEEIADRVVVLRDGRNAGELPRAAIGHDAIVRLMVGRELKQFFQRTHRAKRTDDNPSLDVRDLRWTRAQRQGISFALRPGEIVGMAGLMGAG